MLDKKNQDGPQEDLDDILKDFDEQDELHQRIQEFKKKKEASSAQQEELKERGQIQEEPEEAKTSIEQLKAMQEEKKETEERMEKQRVQKREQEERQYNLKIDGKDVADLTGKLVELLGTSTSTGVTENGVSTFDVLA